MCYILLQHARVAALEKQNRDLSWQVAMLARPGEKQGAKPARVSPSGLLPTSTQARPRGRCVGPPFELLPVSQPAMPLQWPLQSNRAHAG